MNGDEEYEASIADVDPDWMSDGLGISGEQSDPDFGEASPWDVYCWSKNDQVDEDFGACG